MIGQVYPLFRAGHLLRTEMLEAFTEYSFRFGELLYAGYANGIISGCELTTTNDAIIVHPGMVLFYGKIFYIREPAVVNYAPTDELRVLKLCYLGEERSDSMVRYEMELSLTADASDRDGQIELCRFTLQQGARLRYAYQDFADRSTEYDTLNRIHSAFAAPGHSTLYPAITKAFAREMLANSIENQTDASFCIELLSHDRPVSAEAIAAYIRIRNGGEPVEEKNACLYNGLLAILREAKGEAGPQNTPVLKRRHILID